MLFISQIRVGALELIILSSVFLFHLFMSVTLLSEHVAMVKECRVKNREVYRTLPGAV